MCECGQARARALRIILFGIFRKRSWNSTRCSGAIKTNSTRVIRRVSMSAKKRACHKDRYEPDDRLCHRDVILTTHACVCVSFGTFDRRSSSRDRDLARYCWKCNSSTCSGHSNPLRITGDENKSGQRVRRESRCT